MTSTTRIDFDKQQAEAATRAGHPAGILTATYRVYRLSWTLPEVWDPPKGSKTDIIIIIFVFPKEFSGFRVHEERGEEEGKGEGEGERERKRAGHGFLTFWMVKGRPTSGVGRKSAWTVTFAHEGYVLVKTSLQKRTFYGCFKGFSPK